jgi:hypothetical protein
MITTETLKRKNPNFFNPETLAILEQTESDFKIRHIGGPIYTVVAPTRCNGQIAGYVCRWLYNTKSGKLTRDKRND